MQLVCSLLAPSTHEHHQSATQVRIFQACAGVCLGVESLATDVS